MWELMQELWCRLFHKKHWAIYPYVERDAKGIKHQKVADKLKCYKCGCWIEKKEGRG